MRHTNIKPWVVVPCDDLDWYKPIDMKLFLSKEDANKYAISLLEEHGYFFCDITQMEIN